MIYNNLTASLRFHLIQTWFKVLFIGFAAALAGCTSLPDMDESGQHRLPSTKQQLSKWRVSGKILLSTPEEKHSGYFYWQQDGDKFKFAVNSFIGTNILTLEKKADHAQLEYDGKEFQDLTASALLYRLTGNYVPVNEFKYWLLGIDRYTSKATAKSPVAKDFTYQDNQENEWQVKYAKSKVNKGFNVPGQMTIMGQQTKIKMSLSDWGFIQ